MLDTGDGQAMSMMHGVSNLYLSLIFISNSQCQTAYVNNVGCIKHPINGNLPGERERERAIIKIAQWGELKLQAATLKWQASITRAIILQ